jgi:hypothetical protein
MIFYTYKNNGYYFTICGVSVYTIYEILAFSLF